MLTAQGHRGAEQTLTCFHSSDLASEAGSYWQLLAATGSYSTTGEFGHVTSPGQPE
jgi:hypothetical protein